jgi:tetratricopeptide (TPR) repeat protein
METHTQHLDSEELFHLAMAAGLEGQHEKAISLLKQAWAQDPRDPMILYCLGAEHAQIGMHERAMAEMERAIEMAPALDTARIQLALLCFAHALLERGEACLQPLLERQEADCMGHFARGLVALGHDDLLGCRQAVERGITLNVTNAALNDDMVRLLEAIHEDAGQTEAPHARPVALALPQEPPASDPAPSQAADNLWMSSYRKVGSGR